MKAMTKRVAIRARTVLATVVLTAVAGLVGPGQVGPANGQVLSCPGGIFVFVNVPGAQPIGQCVVLSPGLVGSVVLGCPPGQAPLLFGAVITADGVLVSLQAVVCIVVTVPLNVTNVNTNTNTAINTNTNVNTNTNTVNVGGDTINIGTGRTTSARPAASEAGVQVSPVMAAILLGLLMLMLFRFANRRLALQPAAVAPPSHRASGRSSGPPRSGSPVGFLAYWWLLAAVGLGIIVATL